MKYKLLHTQFELTSRKTAEPDKMCYYKRQNVLDVPKSNIPTGI